MGLVTFNNEVGIIGDASQPAIVLAGDKLDNHALLVQAGRDCQAMTQGIETSRQRLSERLFDLEECGQTALGPAMIVAINMAAAAPGSQVIVCTDGKANRGLGRLEDLPEGKLRLCAAFATVQIVCHGTDCRMATTIVALSFSHTLSPSPPPVFSSPHLQSVLTAAEAAQFYAGLADSAKSKGVTVSVVSIAGEECRLEHLGTVADVTGGEVERVDPLKLAENFQALLSNPIIACDVKGMHVCLQVRISRILGYKQLD